MSRVSPVAPPTHNSTLGEAKRLWRTVVDRFTRLSGRSLRPTGSGRVVLLLAFVVGFAAMNTGNNLLFFGWGLVLSSIIISGILSESTLQAATATPLPPDELRAGADNVLPVIVENRRKLPGFGVEISLVFHKKRGHGPRNKPASVVVDDVADGAEVRTGAAFELRLSPGARHEARVPFAPADRGVLDVKSLRVATAAPFGFFAKERIVGSDSLALSTLVVLPERVDTRALGRALWARLGENPAGHAGNGDELFSMRPFRSGDDPRRIAWRRAAKTGRLVIRENEATRSREIIVDVRVGGSGSPDDDDDAEDAVATAGSLVEDLLDDGHNVGVRAPGLLVPPSRSPRQRFACLHGLALWERPSDGSATAERSGGAAIVAVVAGGAGSSGARADDADVVVQALRRPSRDRPARDRASKPVTT